MNANVAVSPNNQSLIPRAVNEAIDEVRSAVIRQHDAGQRLLESIVKLYIACRDADVRLTVRELARQTDCSPAYLSQAWRATEKAVTKRRPALEEAGKLGFNKFVKKYVTVKPRAPQKPDEKPETEHDGKNVFARLRAFHDDLKRNFALLAPVEQERLVDDLMDLAVDLRRQLPETPDRPREAQRRQARH